LPGGGDLRAPRVGEMSKAILLLDQHGAARAPAVLCADSVEEAQTHSIPLFTTMFAHLTVGKDLCPNGHGYDLFENGRPVGTLEIFAPAVGDGGIP
jgi:hypothetical protein